MSTISKENCRYFSTNLISLENSENPKSNICQNNNLFFNLFRSVGNKLFSSIAMKTLNDVFCKTKNLRNFLKSFIAKVTLLSAMLVFGAKLAMRQNITSRYPIRRSFPSINDLRGRAPSFKGPCQHGANHYGKVGGG